MCTTPRVALRRLRSDLRLFGPLLDADAVDPLRIEISWFASELGIVRDLDVMREVVVSLAEAARVDSAPVAVELAERRVAAQVALNNSLMATRSKRLRRELEGLAVRPPLSEQASRPASAVLPDRARLAFRRLQRAVAATGPDAPPDAVHLVRIQAKRARYASETVAVSLGVTPPKVVRHLTVLQDHLGLFHDHTVASDWLREFGPSATAPAVAFVAGALAAASDYEAERLATTWRPLWQRSYQARPRRP